MVAERDEHGRFVKGHASNGGRPKGLAEQARAVAKDGAALIQFFWTVLNDDKQDTKVRMQAAEWLADRGWGKAVQQTDLNVTGGTLVELRWDDGSDGA